MQNPALALLLKLPVALVAHICTLLGVYPTNDVGSMLVLSRSTHAEWKSCDLLFFALKNQLNSRPKFQGVHDTTSSTTTTIKPPPSRQRRGTFWSYRFKAKLKDNFWRLDYFICSKRMSPRLLRCESLEEYYGCSDHCPIVLEIKN